MGYTCTLPAFVTPSVKLNKPRKFDSTLFSLKLWHKVFQLLNKQFTQGNDENYELGRRKISCTPSSVASAMMQVVVAHQISRTFIRTISISNSE